MRQCVGWTMTTGSTPARSHSLLTNLDWLKSTARGIDPSMVTNLVDQNQLLINYRFQKDNAEVKLDFVRDKYGSSHPLYKQAWIEACEIASALGDEAQVEELLGDVERLPPSERTPRLVAQEARFRGRLLALRGDQDGAAGLLARAVDGFRTLQMPYYLAMALVEQAELGVEDPAPLLAEAREILERLGAKPWLERVDAAERAVAV